MAIAMVVAAAAFGITAGIAVVVRPPASAPVVVQVPGAPANIAAAAPTASATSDTPNPTPTVSAATLQRGPIAASLGKVAPAASATATTVAAKGPLNLHSLTGSSVAPNEDPGGGEAPKAPGQCISEGQVQQIIGLHSVGLRRACWERSTSQKPTANITVSLAIGADGTAQGVSASGDDSAVANCIANDVKNWRFPAMGCSQKTAIPFHFVRQ